MPQNPTEARNRARGFTLLELSKLSLAHSLIYLYITLDSWKERSDLITRANQKHLSLTGILSVLDITKNDVRRSGKGTRQSKKDLGAKWGTEGKRTAQGEPSQAQSIPGDLETAPDGQ